MKNFDPSHSAFIPNDFFSTTDLRLCGGVWFSSGELAAALFAAGDEEPVPTPDQTQEFLSALISFLGSPEVFFQGFSQPVRCGVPHPIRQGLVYSSLGFDAGSAVLGLSPRWKDRWDRRLSRRQKPTAGPSEYAKTINAAAVPVPQADLWARKILPAQADHESFLFRSRPTRIGFLTLGEEGLDGWRSWYAEGDEKPLFLVRLVPKTGRAAVLPSEGWQNILNHVLRRGVVRHSSPLKELPRRDTLGKLPFWEYDVEAGPRNQVPASWKVQVFLSRRLLSSWLGEDREPSETSVLLRLFKRNLPWETGNPVWEVPADRADTLAVFLGCLDAPDLRTVVQNFLLPLTGAGGLGRLLYYKDVVRLSSRTLVKVLSSPRLPEAQIEAVLGPRPRQDLDQARRHGRVAGPSEWRDLQEELCLMLETRLRSHELDLSPLAMDAWECLYRRPLDAAQERELTALVSTAPWSALLSSDVRIGEDVLRSLDVTDAALCLRAVPDGRWRRLVTARREEELKKEMDFLEILEARGELSLDRTLDAWRQFHRLWKEKTELWG